MILDNGVKTTEANAKDKRPYLSLVGARLAFTISLFLLQHWLWMLSHCYLKGIKFLCHLLAPVATFFKQ